MNAHLKIQLTLASLVLVGTTHFLNISFAEQPAAEEVRFALHQLGFKTDLSDFKMTVPKEMSDRAAALPTIENKWDPNRPKSFLNDTDLMTPVGESAAVVIWRQAVLVKPAGFAVHEYAPEVVKDFWPVLRESFDTARPQLDAAATALLSGPFQYSLNLDKGPGVLGLDKGPASMLPHLVGLKYLEEMFAGRAILALHDQDQGAAWMNLLAATRIVTGWQTEPVEFSQYMRFYCLETAYDLTWQALQSGNWPESDLASLEREWESLDLFKNLTDEVGLDGANYVEMYRLERQRNHFATEEVADSLRLFCLERELATANALLAKTWKEMRQLPGVTNQVAFQPPGKGGNSQTLARMRMQARTTGWPNKGLGLIGRAAESEGRRRLAVAAIAITRFQTRHRSLPKSLAELAPEFVTSMPVDFMDGQPLHYRPGNDGHFLLYSVGLNCLDDGGKMPAVSYEAQAMAVRRGTIPAMEGDLVWPVPASTDEAKAHFVEKERQFELQEAEWKKQIADHEAKVEAARTTTIQELITDPKYRKTACKFPRDQIEPFAFKGNPLEKVILNKKSAGTNSPSFDELLTLRQVITGDEPGIITYQLPIDYDVVTRMKGGSIGLAMDSPPEESYEPTLAECRRATNGDCVLVWNTTYDRPGQHALQVLLVVPTGASYETIQIKGPVAPYFSSNLCQFFEGGSIFDDHGANLGARSSQPHEEYKIQIKTLSGEILKTITGTATNAKIHESWDLIDEQGRKYTNSSFDAYFTIKLPGTDRSQTLKERFSKLDGR